MESVCRACRLAMLDDHLEVKLRPEHSQTTVSFSHCRSCSEALTSRDNAKLQQRSDLSLKMKTKGQGRESQRSLGKLTTDLGSKKSSCLQCKRSCQICQIIHPNDETSCQLEATNQQTRSMKCCETSWNGSICASEI